MDKKAMNFLTYIIIGTSLYFWNTNSISTAELLIIQSINLLTIAFINKK